MLPTKKLEVAFHILWHVFSFEGVLIYLTLRGQSHVPVTALLLWLSVRQRCKQKWYLNYLFEFSLLFIILTSSLPQWAFASINLLDSLNFIMSMYLYSNFFPLKIHMNKECRSCWITRRYTNLSYLPPLFSYHIYCFFMKGAKDSIPTIAFVPTGSSNKLIAASACFLLILSINIALHNISYMFYFRHVRYLFLQNN